MLVSYEDEYGEQLIVGDSRSFPAIVGDIVIIDDNEWVVKARTIYPDRDIIVITLTEYKAKIKENKPIIDNRITEMTIAVANIKSAQLKQEKKQRILSEEVVSMRTYIRNTKDKK